MDAGSTPRLHVQIAHHLRELITSGDLRPGDELPSEAELCRRFRTSRSPVRQALTALRTEGLISAGQGRRSVVLSQASSQSFSTLLSFTEWCRSLGVTPGQWTLELARRPASEETAELLDTDPAAPVVEILRLRSMDGTPVMLERATFPLDVGRHLFDVDTDACSIYEHLTSRGIELYRAEHRIDALAAPEADAAVLGTDPGSPLLRVRRQTTDLRGRVVELADDRYLPEHATFTVVNTRTGTAGLHHGRGTAAPSWTPEP
ncbi:GntR family transcriptional regulator [Corynebacterium bovis]|uniref:GntR family transcriptional regulator n=1 Tax=Corynebacterium bovis TaxID=36808 RepID=UPI000F64FC0C|nr:GntR family transcriptional regulator [Corynebacterium bovis]RRQ12155.1 GntR family transcriptional regulator [Corynebacterium bovis]